MEKRELTGEDIRKIHEWEHEYHSTFWDREHKWGGMFDRLDKQRQAALVASVRSRFPDRFAEDADPKKNSSLRRLCWEEIERRGGVEFLEPLL